MLPTSNDVERLFSMSKRIYSVKRRSLSPTTLEGLVFLKCNRGLWNLSLVGVVANENKDKDNDSDKNEDVYEDDESSDNEDSK